MKGKAPRPSAGQQASTQVDARRSDAPGPRYPPSVGDEPRSTAPSSPVDGPLPLLLGDARPSIEKALAAAGFEILSAETEPNLIRGHRVSQADSTSVVVDAGGQMRYTRTRQLSPEAAETRQTPRGRAWQVTRRQDETITVSHLLRPTDAQVFGALLKELDAI